jgi:hypothetical protein
VGSQSCEAADEAGNRLNLAAGGFADELAWILKIENRCTREAASGNAGNGMTRAVLKVDQFLSIGRDIRISPTDIDSKGIRLIAHGRVMGGPNDGAAFEDVHEMAIGSSVHLSPHVVVTLVEVRGRIARLDVFAPANVAVKNQ